MISKETFYSPILNPEKEPLLRSNPWYRKYPPYSQVPLRSKFDSSMSEIFYSKREDPRYYTELLPRDIQIHLEKYIVDSTVQSSKIDDVQNVVLDPGSFSWKVGYSGDDEPLYTLFGNLGSEMLTRKLNGIVGRE